MKNNKLISALLVLLVCLSLVVSVSATGSVDVEPDLTFTVEASASTVKPGDSVTVSVGVAEHTGFYGALVTLKYDPALFEIERNDAGVITNLNIEKNTADFGSDLFVGLRGTGLLTINVGGNLLNLDENAPKFEKSGTIIKATFTVKEDINEDVFSLFTLEAHAGNVFVDGMAAAEAVAVDYIQNCNLVSPNHDCGNYEPATDAAVPADCLNAGLTEGSHCPLCYKVHVAQQETPAKGHSYGEWRVVVEATTERAGEEQRVCSACGAFESREIAKLPANNTPVIVALVIAGVALIALVAVFVIRKKKLFFWK